MLSVIWALLINGHGSLIKWSFSHDIFFTLSRHWKREWWKKRLDLNSAIFLEFFKWHVKFLRFFHLRFVFDQRFFGDNVFFFAWTPAWFFISWHLINKIAWYVLTFFSSVVLWSSWLLHSLRIQVEPLMQHRAQITFLIYIVANLQTKRSPPADATDYHGQMFWWNNRICFRTLSTSAVVCALSFLSQFCASSMGCMPQCVP